MKKENKNKTIFCVVIGIVILIVLLCTYYVFSKISSDSETVTESKIEFGEQSYKCEVGETIYVMIKTHMIYDGNLATLPYVTSYSSSDETIATIRTSDDLNLNCVDCRLYKVDCLKKGTTTLNTTASNGDKATAEVTVD
ncbi:MAG: hypothetical protein IJ068_07175 [Bacilli bacterium]|nr:hypothetical protein [Bacilli bacterium]